MRSDPPPCGYGVIGAIDVDRACSQVDAGADRVASDDRAASASQKTRRSSSAWVARLAGCRAGAAPSGSSRLLTTTRPSRSTCPEPNSRSWCPGSNAREEVHSTTRILAVFLAHGDLGGITGGRQARIDQGLPDGWIAPLRSIEEVEHVPSPFVSRTCPVHPNPRRRLAARGGR